MRVDSGLLAALSGKGVRIVELDAELSECGVDLACCDGDAMDVMDVVCGLFDPGSNPLEDAATRFLAAHGCDAGGKVVKCGKFA